MSGGSWDYVYYKFEEVADRLRSEGRIERRAFGDLVARVAKAMHDIEWVDSCDMGPGDEVAAIRAALGGDAAAYAVELREATKIAEAAAKQLEGALMRARDAERTKENEA